MRGPRRSARARWGVLGAATRVDPERVAAVSHQLRLRWAKSSPLPPYVLRSRGGSRSNLCVSWTCSSSEDRAGSAYSCQILATRLHRRRIQPGRGEAHRSCAPVRGIRSPSTYPSSSDRRRLAHRCLSCRRGGGTVSRVPVRPAPEHHLVGRQHSVVPRAWSGARAAARSRADRSWADSDVAAAEDRERALDRVAPRPRRGCATTGHGGYRKAA